jgi:hypothetical protein
MNKQEALNKLEAASTLMSEVLGVLSGHNFSELDRAIKICYGVEDYLEKQIIAESNVLKYKNNWESDEYYLGDKKLENFSAVEIDGTRYNVLRRLIARSYSDHGHQYTATSWHYYIEVMVFSTVMEMDLNTIVNKTKVKFVE